MTTSIADGFISAKKLREKTEENLAKKIKDEYELAITIIQRDIEQAILDGSYSCDVKFPFKYEQSWSKIILELENKGFQVRYYEGIKELSICWK